MRKPRRASSRAVVSETAPSEGQGKSLTSGERQQAGSAPGRPFTSDDPRINRRGPAKGLVAFIKEQTGDGEELAMFALRTLRDESIRFGAELVTPTMRDRQWAVEWLADRAFGRAPNATEDNDAIKQGLTVIVQSLAAKAGGGE